MNMNIMMLEDIIYRLNNLTIIEEEQEEVTQIMDIICDIIVDLEERI